MRSTIVLFFLSAALLAYDAGPVAYEMDSEGWKNVNIEDIGLSWMISEDSVTFRISAPTQGWVAVGFGGGPAMKDANLIIGYADEEGSHFRDDHGTSPVSHSADVNNGGSDDLLSAEVIEEDGNTIFTFTLPLASDDELDPVMVPGESLRILLAYGNSDGFTGMHRSAHTAEIEF
jgi:hypothetical protein